MQQMQTRLAFPQQDDVVLRIVEWLAPCDLESLTHVDNSLATFWNSPLSWQSMLRTAGAGVDLPALPTTNRSDMPRRAGRNPAGRGADGHGSSPGSGSRAPSKDQNHQTAEFLRRIYRWVGAFEGRTLVGTTCSAPALCCQLPLSTWGQLMEELPLHTYKQKKSLAAAVSLAVGTPSCTPTPWAFALRYDAFAVSLRRLDPERNRYSLVLSTVKCVPNCNCAYQGKLVCKFADSRLTETFNVNITGCFTFYPLPSEFQAKLVEYGYVPRGGDGLGIGPRIGGGPTSCQCPESRGRAGIGAGIGTGNDGGLKPLHVLVAFLDVKESCLADMD